MFILFLLAYSLSQQILQTPLYGNTETLGYYFLTLYAGTPPVKQTVIVDTGSSLTAFPCTGCTSCGTHMDSYFDYTQSTTFKHLSCESGIVCSACNNGVCEYKQTYNEGSAISGMLVEDVLAFEQSEEQDFLFPSVFGCHLRETNLFRSQKADGIMGIARKKNNINSIIDNLYETERILTNTFAICLNKENGVFTIGGYNSSLHAGEIVWTKLYDEVYYSVKLTGLRVGSYKEVIDPDDLPKLYTTGTILDSGTTFTYLFSKVYTEFIKGFQEFCEKDRNCEGEAVKVDGEPQKCFVFSNKTSLSQFFSTFPIIKVEFEGGTVYWRPENYLFAWPETPNYFCLGIYSNFEGNILGSTFMRGNDVIFDRSQNRAGFVPAFCDVGSEGDRSMSAYWSEKRVETGGFRDFPVFGVVLVSCSVMGVLSFVIWVIGKRKVMSEEGFGEQ